MTEIMVEPCAHASNLDHHSHSKEFLASQNQSLLSRQLFPQMAPLGELVRLAIAATNARDASLDYVRKRLLPPLLLNQYRLYYGSTILIGAITWALFNEETEKRYLNNNLQVGETDWRSGDKLWVTDILAPSGHEDKMIANLKATVFADTELRIPTLNRNRLTAMFL